MDRMEMVEKLQSKANVSYEEARNALEANDWDLLDALVMLEAEGKVKRPDDAAGYSTRNRKEKAPEPRAKAVKDTAMPALARVWEWIKDMIRKGNRNQLVISRKHEEIVALPITLAVLLLIFLPVGLTFIVIGAFIGVLFGVRYALRGPDISPKVSEAMTSAQEKAARAVELRKDDFKKAGEETAEKTEKSVE